MTSTSTTTPTRGRPRKAALAVVLAAATALTTATVGVPATASAQAAPAGSSAPGSSAPVPHPAEDPFYRYDGATPLAQLAPGTPIRRRETVTHLEGIPTPLRVTQVLFRTADSGGTPTVTATSVLHPTIPANGHVVSYQSAYDSLAPDCQPSYAIAGGFDRGLVATGETTVMTGYLLGGTTVVMTDFEGQDPHFAAGREYGQATLDGLRAAGLAEGTGVTPESPIAIAGYSGGAIATQWASELAPEYAPDVNRRLVGAAIGGVFARPLHNLPYVDGSAVWKAVMPMAILGMARSYGADLDPYLSEYGRTIMREAGTSCILDGFVNTAVKHPTMTWMQLVKPEYADPESIPEIRRIGNDLVMGTRGTPTVPMMVREGANGWLEGTRGDKPGIGPGDGVMVLGDVRALAREYCRRGVTIDYDEYPLLSHFLGAAAMLVQAPAWIEDRFAGRAAPSTCGQLEPGGRFA